MNGGQAACESRCALLFTRASAGHELRQLRPEVGEEAEEESTILNLSLRFVGSEVIVDPLKLGLCSRAV